MNLPSREIIGDSDIGFDGRVGRENQIYSPTPPRS